MLRSLSASRRFCMSAWMASAIPGYWTFTATCRPSSRTARCTCPIDAAASGSSSNSANSAESFPHVLLDHLTDGLEGHGLGVLLKHGQNLLKLGADLLRHQPQVDRRERLPHLHGRPRMLPSTLTSVSADLSCWREARSRRLSEAPRSASPGPWPRAQPPPPRSRSWPQLASGENRGSLHRPWPRLALSPISGGDNIAPSVPALTAADRRPAGADRRRLVRPALTGASCRGPRAVLPGAAYSPSVRAMISRWISLVPP